MPIEADHPADDARRGAVLTLPEPVTEDGRTGTTAYVIGTREQAARSRRSAERAEVIATHVATSDTTCLTAFGEVESRLTERSDRAECVLAVAELLPERIGEVGVPRGVRVRRS